MSGCGGIIPGTHAACGEAGFYCETECFHEQLRREGAASLAFFILLGETLRLRELRKRFAEFNETPKERA